MSTPHTLPPARFDRRIDTIYARNKLLLAGTHAHSASLPRIHPPSDAESRTPILSLCGGATDMMIPSESCILPALPAAPASGPSPYRKTVFASALQGAWTGVGHREMVWCHQVRWRVARAALALAHALPSASARTAALEAWLGDGRSPPVAFGSIRLDPGEGVEALRAGEQLVLRAPSGFRERTWLLPASAADRPRAVVYVSGGSIPPVSAHAPGSLRVTVYHCPSLPLSSEGGSPVDCAPVEPSVHKLLPSPASGKPFPVPEEGVGESEGVVVLEAELPSAKEGFGWVAVRVQEPDGQGWVAAGFASDGASDGIGTFGWCPLADHTASADRWR
jgi:GPI inositol-deacylase